MEHKMRIRNTAPTARARALRTGGLLLAGLVQLVVVLVLVQGLPQRVWPVALVNPIIEIIAPTQRERLPPPGLPKEADPQELPRMPAPDFAVEGVPLGDTGITTIAGLATPAGPVDMPAVSVRETHTIPPYPPVMARLGAEGEVRLRLTVTAQGHVGEAVVIRSSGYAELDRAARAWVIAHWRYRPAIRGGSPVASQTEVLIRFALRDQR